MTFQNTRSIIQTSDRTQTKFESSVHEWFHSRFPYKSKKVNTERKKSMDELQILTIDGVSCYEEDGTAYLKLEDVARGLGFTTIAASGNEVIRWNTVHRYLNNLGVATSCNGATYKEMCPDFIPENIFYRLAMKAKNEVAEKFQAKVACKSKFIL